MTNLTQVPMYTSLNDLVDLSAIHTGDSIELDCSLTLHVNGVEHQAYTVNLANRDLLFYTNRGTITYLVDSYGTKNLAVLHDWSLDSDD